MSDARPEIQSPLLNRILEGVREMVDPDYFFVDCGPIPWTPAPASLEDLRVSLITTGGFHLSGDPSFRTMEDPKGDTSFRVIPHGTERQQLALDAPYVEQKFAPVDPEVALPMNTLEKLHEENCVGPPARRHFTLVGGVVYPLPGLAESADEIKKILIEDEANAVVLLPTCSLCVQTVCVMARELEARGFPTITLSLLHELSEMVGAPRMLNVKFPFGAPCGDPGNEALHCAVLTEALEILVNAGEPGETRSSKYSWRRTP